MSFSDQATDDNNKPDSSTNDDGTPKVETPTLTVGGKTLTLEEAQKKLENQEQFIETLKQERAEDVKVNETLADRIENLEKSTQTAEGLQQLLSNLEKPNQAPASETSTQNEQISTEELTAKVKAELKQDEIVAKQKQNMDASMLAAKEAYGEDFVTKIISLGKDAGYDLDGIDDLANNHPTAFAKLFLPAEKEEAGKPNVTQSTVGGDVGQQDATQTQRVSFSKMRKSADRSADIARRIAEKEAAANS